MHPVSNPSNVLKLILFRLRPVSGNACAYCRVTNDIPHKKLTGKVPLIGV
jgi:hypothetical protein